MTDAMADANVGRPDVSLYAPPDRKPAAPVFRLCRNCRHCTVPDPDRIGETAVCEQSGYTDRVSGQVRLRLCSTMRSWGGECGPDGDLFEPRLL